MAVIAFDRFHAVENNEGVITVRVQKDRGEHHATTKKAAVGYMAKTFPAYTVDRQIKKFHARDSDGYPGVWAVFSVK